MMNTITTRRLFVTKTALRTRQNVRYFANSKHEEIGVEPPKDPNQDTLFGKIIRKEIKG